MASQALREPEIVLKEMKTAARHTAVYGFGSIIIKALGFLMLPFYTHFLNPSEYGLLEILDLSMSLFGMVLHMGIAPALLRSYASAGTVEEKKRTVSTAFLFVAGTALFTFAVGIGWVAPVSRMLLGPAVPSTYLVLSFSSFLLSYLGTMPRTYLRALEASGTFTAIETGGLFSMLLLNIYFIAVLKLGAMGILWSSVIVNGVLAVGTSVWMVRAVGVGFSAHRIRQMAAFGLPLIFSNVALFALNFSDRFFLQRLRSLEVVGFYAVGYKLAFMINYLVVQPFYAMWQARMYGIYAQPEHEKIFRQIFVMYSLLLTYVALGLSVFSPEIVGLMADPKFASGRDVVPIVALAYVFYGIGFYVQLGMFLANRTKAIGAVSAVAAVLNLGLNYVLIGRFGMLGAAWATLLGFLIIAVGSYWFSQKALPLNLGMPRVLSGVLLAIGLYMIGWMEAAHSILFVIALKVCLVLSFPALVWKLRVLSPDEMGTLESMRDRATTILSRQAGLIWRRVTA